MECAGYKCIHSILYSQNVPIDLGIEPAGQGVPSVIVTGVPNLPLRRPGLRMTGIGIIIPIVISYKLMAALSGSTFMS